MFTFILLSLPRFDLTEFSSYFNFVLKSVVGDKSDDSIEGADEMLHCDRTVHLVVGLVANRNLVKVKISNLALLKVL